MARGDATHISCHGGACSIMRCADARHDKRTASFPELSATDVLVKALTSSPERKMSCWILVKVEEKQACLWGW